MFDVCAYVSRHTPFMEYLAFQEVLGEGRYVTHVISLGPKCLYLLSRLLGAHMTS